MDTQWKFIAVIYCVLIIITSDFIMNLVLGVFCEEFKKEKQRVNDIKLKELE